MWQGEYSSQGKGDYSCSIQLNSGIDCGCCNVHELKVELNFAVVILSKKGLFGGAICKKFHDMLCLFLHSFQNAHYLLLFKRKPSLLDLWSDPMQPFIFFRLTSW